MLRALTASAIPARASCALRAHYSRRGLSAMVAMEEEYLGMPKISPAEPVAHKTTVSQLNNGVKVVSHENSQLGAAVGIVVASGSRDEAAAETGASMLLEAMAYKRTFERSSIRLHRDIEMTGANCMVIGGREKMTYMVDCPPEAADVNLTAIAETVMSPKLAPWDVKDAKEQLAEHTLKGHNTESTSLVEEALHSAAFGDTSPLGRPYKVGPCRLSADGLEDFRASRFKAPEMAVLGVNVPHESLESHAESLLGSATSTDAAKRAPCKYVGGEMRIRADTDTTSVTVAFEAPAASSTDAPAYEVLGVLLDLRAKSIVSDGMGFNLAYTDAGLVGVTGTAPHRDAAELAHSVVACFKDLALGPSSDEVTAAIAAAKMCRNIEMETPVDTLVTLSNFLGSGVDPVKGASALDEVSPESVKKAAAKMVKSELTMAAVGEVSMVPAKADIKYRF